MRGLHMGAWALGLLLGTQAGGAAPAHKLYVDPANGVTFSYPAGWLLNGDDDAATAKFRVTTAGQPSAVVQLEGNFAEGGPYVGSDFESGAFTYVVVGGRTEASCFAVVDNSSEGTQAPVTALWNGARARRLDATYTVAGTDDIHRMVAAYRGGRCYLFETSIVRRSAETVAKPLPEARWRYLRGEFDAVLASVRFAARNSNPESQVLHNE